MLLLIGTGLYVFYSVGASSLPTGISIATKFDAVFPYFIAHELPVGLAGLVIASVFAACAVDAFQFDQLLGNAGALRLLSSLLSPRRW